MLKVLTFLIATFVSINASTAQTGVELYAKYYCNLCHGEDAAHPTQSDYPKLAGQNADFLYNQLIAFKYKKRTNDLASLMIPMVEPISDTDLRKIANYISTLNSNKWLDGSHKKISAGEIKTVTASALNVRSQPSINGQAVGTLTEGTQVKVLEIDGNWARITDSEWVWSSFLN